MWGAISRLFDKKKGRYITPNEGSMMDRGDDKRTHDPLNESYGTKQAKQRATVKWMLSKAYNNRVPENLREPFYRNHEDQEHLKPQLVHLLANAELYCMALSNIYSDPNYNNLNHCSVLQALNRKGVYLSDPHITETVLIQTTPIKLSAHQVVMQAVMTLYAKEVLSPELVVDAIQRSMVVDSSIVVPQDHEQALLLWINHATRALKLRADQEEAGKSKCPEFPRISQLQDLCDGACLAGVVSFYCPEELHWSSIRVSKLPTVSDCVRNLTLVAEFSQRALLFNIFHMAPEDVYYMRGTMKHNLVVFLADLFNLLEIHPSKCVTLNSTTKTNSAAEGRNIHGVAHKRSLPQAVSVIPDLRSGIDTPSSFSGSPVLSGNNLKKSHFNFQNDSQTDNGKNDDFVVHRGKGVPTLSSILTGNDSNHISNNRLSEPAGKPTNWESTRKQSFAGRRSRRNSLSDDSQLTIENFGGSHENVHLIGRNPDKEPAVLHSGRRESIARSSVLDNNSDALHNALQETYNQQSAPEPAHRVTLSRNNSFVESQKRAEESRSSAGIQQTLLDPPTSPPSPHQKMPEVRHMEKEKKVTTFAALPNSTTTWQQQSLSNQNVEPHDNGISSPVDSGVMGSQLINIRLKLEEKRRRIESEKRRMEAHMNRQRQKVGKAAFLQAVSKGKVVKSPESDPGRETSSSEIQASEPKPARPFSLQDITEVEQKWLTGDGFVEEQKTPDMDNMDLETYQKSIAQMNSSLHEIQADLQRLSHQQTQLQNNQINHLKMQQTQQQSTPPPQMQSFASLHQQGGGMTSQHITFTSPSYSPQPPTQVYQGAVLNSFNNQQPVDYYNGGGNMRTVSGGFNCSQQHHQIQQMHSLMNNASNQANYNNQPQQWHSLSQHPPSNYDFATPNTRYNQGFKLHGNNYEENYSQVCGSQPSPQPPAGEFYLHEPSSHNPPTVKTWGHPNANTDNNTWTNRREPVSLSSSPKQHHFLHNGNTDVGYRTSPPSLAPTPPPRASVNHAPLPTPPVDDMEPQSICFIGSGDDEQLSSDLSKLNITSGSRTYRIPSPTRTYTPVRNSFSQQQEKPEKGFYISFDDDNPPKRPKPPLRTKRNSPKKERGLTQVLDSSSVSNLPSVDASPVKQVNHHYLNSSPSSRLVEKESPHPPPRQKEAPDHRLQPSNMIIEKPIVIGSVADPGALDEMEKKKERILMMSLQRRQAAEEARNLKEAEAARRRDQEKAKEEEKLRKKEEEKRRRAAILEKYKIKKAIEEAEREGKQVDKELLNSYKSGGLSSNTGGMSSGGPKMRTKTGQPSRPRPKTIHIDSGADTQDGTMTPSRGKKGSSSNLSVFASPMRRDYYRGSQDCLTETRKPSASLYSEIGDDSRGTSPGRTFVRRSSYKTSRDPSPEVRSRLGRSKFGTYNAHRKSNSLMNLSGSSCDQDSMVYRFGDTDSGLGRATPPRRAPSPSGPGSLPPNHRRRFDDSMSDAGSDYNGPRLYRQPTTKSNKGIVMNAVEYCVFPGAVNKEAKARVIEEMNKSDAKHFLVLFRDSGCQFRALYAYYPETEEIIKLYGTGPKQVTDRMFDKFFKYNSGGKCFSQVHTKHLTVTIDAFTIHNSLWQGKKVNLPNKRDMTLVI